jgi:serine protease Do
VERSLGSGVIINRQGHLLTSLGVIRNAAEVLARLHDGTELGTTLVGRDDDTGIALLQLTAPAGKPAPAFVPAPLGDSTLLQVGDWVLAVGDPFGTTPYLSAGLVSSPGVSRGVTLSRPGYFSFIASEARVNAGNAGGPLLDAAGAVVGINVTFDDRERPLSFAVPVNVIRDVLPALLKHGQVDRSWLGIYVQEVPPERAVSLGLGAPRGALVTEVVAGGPAALAGILPGDVVLEFDGKGIARHVDLSFAAARTPSDKTVVVKLWRGQKEHALSVRLERKPQ